MGKILCLGIPDAPKSLFIKIYFKERIVLRIFLRISENENENAFTYGHIESKSSLFGTATGEKASIRGKFPQSFQWENTHPASKFHC